MIVPSMTRRQLQFIADVIADLPYEDTRYVTAAHFADHLSSTSARFNRARFMKACGAEYGA